MVRHEIVFGNIFGRLSAKISGTGQFYRKLKFRKDFQFANQSQSNTFSVLVEKFQRKTEFRTKRCNKIHIKLRSLLQCQAIKSIWWVFLFVCFVHLPIPVK